VSTLWPESQTVKVSHKWMTTLWRGCTPEFIRDVCLGRCCRGSGGRVLVSIAPDEVPAIEARGVSVRGGRIQARKRCPFQNLANLCTLHGTDDKPFGCIASPFTVNKSGTLIVRHRYIHFPCFKTGTLPAYVAFRASLDLLFGSDGAAELIRKLEHTGDDVRVPISPDVFARLRYLDGVKVGK